MNILLAGGYDTANVGDHAMLAVLVRDLEARAPGSTVTLLSRHPDPAFDRQFGVTSIRNLDHESREAARGRWFNGLNPGDDTAHLARIRDAMAAADALVIGGGRLLVDVSLGFMRGPLPYLAGLVTLARFFGKPVFIFGMTLVPIESEAGRELARFILGHAAHVTVREEASAQIARSLGVAPARLSVLPDPAFGLHGAPDTAAGAQMLAADDVVTEPTPSGGRPRVALAIRHIYWQQNEARFEAFADEMAEVADGLVTRLDADVVFIPHCTYTHHLRLVDDREVAKAVHARMEHAARAFVLTSDVDLPATLGLYQHVDLLVAQRRHAIAFAALSGVPAVAISDGENVRTMMDVLGQGNRVVPLTGFSPAKVLTEAEQAWQAREPLGAKVTSVVTGLAGETKGYADRLLELL